MLEDLAILTGAEVITEEKGLRLDAIEINVLGQAKKLFVLKKAQPLLVVLVKKNRNKKKN